MESTLYKRTRELLNETLIPHTKIARAVGCCSKTVAVIRDGKNVPNVDLCEAIYNFLSVQRGGEKLEVK